MSLGVEAAFTVINKDAICAQLTAPSATLKQKETPIRRVIFNLGPRSFA